MQRFSKAGGRSVSLWGAVGGTVLGSLVWSACAELPTNPEIAASTIPSGHSHNDYLREEPLWEALENGIPSVEVDVYRVGPILLVGHDTGHLRMERTLRSLYLEPLHELVQQRGDRIFDDGHPLTLLIDIKSEAAPTYGLLRQVLAQYGDMLTEYRSGVVTPKAVNVIVSGNCPQQILVAEGHRYCAYDARIEDLEHAWPEGFAPMVSVDWRRTFGWGGEGVLPEEPHSRLLGLVARCHTRGAILRLWNLPAPAHGVEDVWQTMLDAGVDVVSTDDLERYRRFTEARASR